MIVIPVCNYHEDYVSAYIITDRQTNTFPVNKHTDTCTNRHTDRQVPTYIDRPVDRQGGRQVPILTNTQTHIGRQIDRQTGRHRQTDTDKYLPYTDTHTQTDGQKHLQTDTQTDEFIKQKWTRGGKTGRR